MCVVSKIADDFTRTWPNPFYVTPVDPIATPINPEQWAELIRGLDKPVTRREFDELKKQVQELADLLKAAQKYDKATGQPNCESPDKLALIKALADALGVDLGDLLT